MTRRSRINPWGTALQRTFDAVARGMIKSGTRIVTSGVKQGLANATHQTAKASRKTSQPLPRPRVAAAPAGKAPAARR